jgi:hypothetical protein
MTTNDNKIKSAKIHVKPRRKFKTSVMPNMFRAAVLEREQSRNQGAAMWENAEEWHAYGNDNRAPAGLSSDAGLKK